MPVKFPLLRPLMHSSRLCPRDPGRHAKPRSRVKTQQKPGRYVETVSREDDEWYEVFDMNSYIKTSSCLSLALDEEVYLTVVGSGLGILRFKDGDDCVVEGIYTKLRF